MARIAENAVIQDGVWYNPGEEIPDLGNWVRVHHDGAKRYYEGVSTEIDLLPTYVEHGSRAVCLDTSEIYTFHGNPSTMQIEGLENYIISSSSNQQKGWTNDISIGCFDHFCERFYCRESM